MSGEAEPEKTQDADLEIHASLEDINLGASTVGEELVLPLDSPEYHIDRIDTIERRKKRLAIGGSATVYGMLAETYLDLLPSVQTGNPETDALINSTGPVALFVVGGGGAFIYAMRAPTYKLPHERRLQEWYLVKEPVDDVIAQTSGIFYADGLQDEVGSGLADEDMMDPVTLYDEVLSEWYDLNGDEDLIQTIGTYTRGGGTEVNVRLYAEGEHKVTFTSLIEDVTPISKTYLKDIHSFKYGRNRDVLRNQLS